MQNVKWEVKDDKLNLLRFISSICNWGIFGFLTKYLFKKRFLQIEF